MVTTALAVVLPHTLARRTLARASVSPQDAHNGSRRRATH